MTLRRSTEHVVVSATMGPTIHDVHAWRFSVLPGLIEVQADPARFRPLVDPAGRGLRLSCGAALLNLRLAATQVGREAVVRLLPDPHRPALLAAVRLARRRRAGRSERLLYAATLRPFSSRPAGDTGPPSPAVLNELVAAARLEGVRFVGLSEEGASALLATSGDSPVDWLRAGQALQRVLLGCAVLGVSASFLYEVVDVPVGTDVLQQGDVPQVLLRFGPAVPGVGPVDRDRDRQRDRDRVG
jgi:hypothetical protein